MLHLAITKECNNSPPYYSNVTEKYKDVAFSYYQKYNLLFTQTLLKKYNITHPLTKDVPLGYYQKYNNNLNITKKYNITHPPKDVAFGYYQKYNNNPNITKKIQHNPLPKDVAFGYYQKYNNKSNNLLKTLTTPLFTETLIPPQKKLYPRQLLRNCRVRTRLVRQRPRL